MYIYFICFLKPLFIYELKVLWLLRCFSLVQFLKIANTELLYFFSYKEFLMGFFPPQRFIIACLYEHFCKDKEDSNRSLKKFVKNWKKLTNY